MKTFLTTAAALTAAGLYAGSAHAAFSLVEDWESHATGAQIEATPPGTWTDQLTGPDTVIDPLGDGNNVAQFNSLNEEYFTSLPTAVTPGAGAGEVTTFLQFSATGDVQANRLSVGSAYAGGDNRPVTSEIAGRLFLQDGLIVGGNTSSSNAYLANVGYNVWIVSDLEAFTYDLFVQSDGDANYLTQTLVIDNAAQQSGARTTDLNTFLVRTENQAPAAVSPILVDNIFFDADDRNLVNPIPEPSALALIGLGGLAMLGRRRKA